MVRPGPYVITCLRRAQVRAGRSLAQRLGKQEPLQLFDERDREEVGNKYQSLAALSARELPLNITLLQLALSRTADRRQVT